MRSLLFKIVKQIAIYRHRRRLITSTDRTSVVLRMFYVRYADDWILILLTNGNIQIAEKIKEMISHFKNLKNKNITPQVNKFQLSQTLHFLFQIHSVYLGIRLNRNTLFKINNFKRKTKK
jgi:hypothetical protein